MKNDENKKTFIRRFLGVIKINEILKAVHWNIFFNEF
jgi:hypothetical protein